MPELPIDLRRSTVQTGSVGRATQDTSVVRGIQAVASGLSNLGSAMGQKEKAERAADQSLRRQEYINRQRLLQQEASEQAKSNSGEDGSEALSNFDEIMTKLPNERPEGMNEKTFKSAQVHLKGVEGGIQRNIQSYARGKFIESSGKRVERVDGQNWDMVKQWKSKLILNDYIDSLKTVGEDGFTAMGLSDSQRDSWVNARISERKSEFVEMYGTKNIASAEEMLTALEKGSFTDFDGKVTSLTGDSPSSITGENQGALRNILDSFIQKEGMRIVSAQMESIKAADNLIPQGIKPNINIEALTEDLDNSLPDTWGATKDSIIAQAEDVNARAETTYSFRGKSELAIGEEIARTQRLLSEDSSLSVDQKTELNRKAQQHIKGLKQIRQFRVSQPHQAVLNASKELQQQYTAIQQLTASQQELDPDSPEYRDIQNQKERMGRRYAAGAMAVGRNILGDVDDVRLIGPESTKAFVASYDEALGSGNSDTMTSIFSSMASTYGGVAAANIIQTSFGPRAQEVNMLASMSSTNPDAFNKSVLAMKNWENNKKSIASEDMKSLESSSLTVLDTLKFSYPDQASNPTYIAYSNLVTKISANLLNSGQAATPDEAANQAYASVFADKVFWHEPVESNLFGFGGEEQSAVMIPATIAKANPDIGSALWGINTHNEALKDALLSTMTTNPFMPGVEMDDAMKEELRDANLQVFPSDDESGVVITIGATNAPMVGPDGEVMIVPWDVLQDLGNDAVYPGTRLNDGFIDVPANIKRSLRTDSKVKRTAMWSDFFSGLEGQ